MPVFGAMLADGKFGKFKTIFALSIVYAIGASVMSVTSITTIAQATSPIWWGGVVALVLIATGTGGIKPCVASFGGDQLVHKPYLLQGYFSAYYFMVR